MRDSRFPTAGAHRTPPEENSDQQSPHPNLGVLFVHGIGKQAEGDTVSTWGDALVTWLRDWLGNGNGEKVGPDSLRVTEQGPVQVTDARLRSEPGSLGPPYVDVEVDLPGPSKLDAAEHQTWRLAEAWWAEAFHPPRFSELAFWGFAVLPWALVAHFVTRLQRVWRRRPGEATVIRIAGWMWRILVEVLLVIMAILLSPVLASLVLLMLLLAALPVRQLRQAAAGLQRVLSLTVGDSYVLLGSPSRAASIISRVEESLRAMTDCRALAVVAHSQGAAVAYEALKRTRPSNLRKFVTFGSGQTKLVALKRLQRSKAKRLVWLAPLGLLALMTFAWYGIGQIRAGDSDSAFTLTFLAVFAIIMVISGLLAARTAFTPTPEDLDVGADQGWLDLYASNDPVPNGPLFGIEKHPGVTFDSFQVQNGASALLDHTSYWRNRDEFVPDVAKALAEAAGRSIDRPVSSDEATRDMARARRRWRILCLRSLRWLAVLAFAAIVIGYGDRLPRLGRLLINVGTALVDIVPLVSLQPGGIRAGGGIDPVVGTTAVVVAVTLAYATVATIWRLWERADFGRFVRRERYPLWSLEFVVGLYATAALLGLAWAGPALRWPSVDLSWLVALFLAPIFVLLLAGLTGLVVGVPLGWLLLQVGIIRPGHFPPTAGEWVATAISLYLLVPALAALPGTEATTAAAAFLYGPPILAWVGPPLLSSNRRVRQLLRPLRRLAATELVLWAADRLDGRGDMEEMLLEANRLQDEIERRLDELKKQVGAGWQKDVERLILVPSIWSSKLRRIIGDLTDQAEELATILKQHGRGDVACALLSAAAAYSPTAAIRLWELDPSCPGAHELIKRHAGAGSILSRIRARRVLLSAHLGVDAPRPH